MKKLVDMSTGLVAEYANNGRAIASQVKAKIEHSLDSIPTSMLGEFFARRDVLGSLFSVAREFEALSMSRDFFSDASASLEARSLLGCLSDYWGIDRTHLALGPSTGDSE